jgi:predicted nucleic acid-binding protein
VTLFVDTSAMIRRYVQGPDRALAVEAMAADPVWSASALCRAETLLALHRLSVTGGQFARMSSRLRDDWDAFVVVPVDDRCLAHAVELGATYGLRTVDAVHVAAADRLPRPATYLTYDRHQIPAAAGLGFDVRSPLAPAP